MSGRAAGLSRQPGKSGIQRNRVQEPVQRKVSWMKDLRSCGGDRRQVVRPTDGEGVSHGGARGEFHIEIVGRLLPPGSQRLLVIGEDDEALASTGDRLGQ